MHLLISWKFQVEIKKWKKFVFWRKHFWIFCWVFGVERSKWLVHYFMNGINPISLRFKTLSFSFFLFCCCCLQTPTHKKMWLNWPFTSQIMSIYAFILHWNATISIEFVFQILFHFWAAEVVFLSFFLYAYFCC